MSKWKFTHIIICSYVCNDQGTFIPLPVYPMLHSFLTRRLTFFLFQRTRKLFQMLFLIQMSCIATFLFREGLFCVCFTEPLIGIIFVYCVWNLLLMIMNWHSQMLSYCSFIVLFRFMKNIKPWNILFEVFSWNKSTLKFIFTHLMNVLVIGLLRREHRQESQIVTVLLIVFRSFCIRYIFLLDNPFY